MILLDFSARVARLPVWKFVVVGAAGRYYKAWVSGCVKARLSVTLFKHLTLRHATYEIVYFESVLKEFTVTQRYWIGPRASNYLSVSV